MSTNHAVILHQAESANPESELLRLWKASASIWKARARADDLKRGAEETNKPWSNVTRHRKVKESDR
jgi:hypothetical protein